MPTVTETYLRALATRHRLKLTKRITTGGPRRHYAAFELRGPAAGNGWQELRDAAAQAGAADLVGFALPLDPDTDPRPYLWADSVWCNLDRPEDNDPCPAP